MAEAYILNREGVVDRLQKESYLLSPIRTKAAQ